MGGRNRSRTQRKHFTENRENVWKRPKSDPSLNNNESGDKPAWQPFITQSPDFEEYYKGQEIVGAEEWDTFMEVLRKPLPSAFRINSSGQFCDEIRTKLENDFMTSLLAEAIEGGDEEAIKPLPWYPEHLAWHSNFSRKQLRKTPTLERFHEFLKLENEIGNITRQEAVSMVPPLFLDVHPNHFVLDMCAAPGSKTFQLLEIIHKSTKQGSLPDGMVVANDPDFKRCNLLIHQTKRMCTANLIVTNHDGQQFPGCRLNKSVPETSEIEIEFDSSINQLSFDRVLCDVPCSGDGTLRKAPDIWRKWNPSMGNGVHSLQVTLAMRGLSVLKVGGRMVYSTCSMNPVEDEAVVAEILRRCGGSVELLDVSSELPELVRRPGLRKWKVRDKGMWYASYKDVPNYRRGGIFQSMFPSGKNNKDQSDNNQAVENSGNGKSEDGCKPMEEATSDQSVEEVSDLPLERCMRILPHDQNTGAFFVAVLHKISTLPAAHEKPVGKQRSRPARNDEPTKKLIVEAPESTEVVEVVSADGMDDQLSEETSVADLATIDQVEAVLASEPCNAEPKQPVKAETDSIIAGSEKKVPMQGKWRGFDPIVFLKDETVINTIKTFYGIDESFPLDGHLITRNSDTNCVKRIYYISDSVKNVLGLNFAVGQQLKISSVGLKMFERQSAKDCTPSAPCSFRISSEGLPVILPYITKQILYASPQDFKTLLEKKSIKFSDFVDTQFKEKASTLLTGCCVLLLNEGNKADSDGIQVDASTIAIGCWKGKASLSVLVTELDCQELIERILARMGPLDSVLIPEPMEQSVDNKEDSLEVASNN